MANYTIEGKNVVAKVSQLTEKELKSVKNYLALGYTLVEYKKPKKEPKEAFKAATIQEWLKENATKAQQEEYWERFNSPVIDKDTKQPKVKKNGEPRIRGHVATLAWFKKTFPKYLES